MLSKHWSKKYIEYLVDIDIINGYGDHTFRPSNPVTRAELTKMINKATESISLGKVTFKDVKSGAWYYNDIAISIKSGYVNGYPDNTFKPNNSVKRQEAAKMIALAFNIDGLQETAPFSDANSIPKWATPNVNALAKSGILNGYDDGSFRPLNNLTRAEAAKIIVSSLGISDADL